jgi:hypothetical protein
MMSTALVVGAFTTYVSPTVGAAGDRLRDGWTYPPAA